MRSVQSDFSGLLGKFVCLTVATEIAGDKTIYPLLGLDRDRNGIYVKRLVMGIPAMVQDLLDRKTQDQECQRQYGLAMTRLTQLMWQEGSALKELNDGLYSFIFPDFCTHRRQLAQSLLDYFREHHPAAVPICSACTQVEDQAKVCQQPLVSLGCCDSLSMLVRNHSFLGRNTHSLTNMKASQGDIGKCCQPDVQVRQH